MAKHRTVAERAAAREARAEREAAALASDPVEYTRALMLRSLNAAPRTRAQLAELLASRGVPHDVATAGLDRFTELGLIDDAEYARMWVRSRQQQRGLSRRVLRMELQRKGIGTHDIESALDLVDEADEQDAAVAFARKKARSMGSLAAPVRRQRLMGALMRRGYSPEAAARALREALDEAEDDDFVDF